MFSLKYKLKQKIHCWYSSNGTTNLWTGYIIGYGYNLKKDPYYIVFVDLKNNTNPSIINFTCKTLKTKKEITDWVTTLVKHPQDYYLSNQDLIDFVHKIKPVIKPGTNKTELWSETVTLSHREVVIFTLEGLYE